VVHKRWILGESVENEVVLDAPELGPVADPVLMYEAVARIRMAPLSNRSLLAVVVPALLPIILVFAIEAVVLYM
jgi:hypothetical protein